MTSSTARWNQRQARTCTTLSRSYKPPCVQSSHRAPPQCAPRLFDRAYIVCCLQCISTGLLVAIIAITAFKHAELQRSGTKYASNNVNAVLDQCSCHCSG